MGPLLALTLPGLALALVALGVLDTLVLRPRGRRLLRRGRANRAAPVAYEEFTTLLSPGKRHELDRRQSVSLLRADPDPAGRALPADPQQGVVRVRLRRGRGAGAGGH